MQLTERLALMKVFDEPSNDPLFPDLTFVRARTSTGGEPVRSKMPQSGRMEHQMEILPREGFRGLFFANLDRDSTLERLAREDYLSYRSRRLLFSPLNDCRRLLTCRPSVPAPGARLRLTCPEEPINVLNHGYPA
jgi:hypothetical protein